MIKARTWSSAIESDGVDLEDRYFKAVLNLAALQASETIDKYEENGEEVPEGMRPSLEEAEDIIQLVRENQPPPWWPKTLSRMLVKISVEPEGETKENMRPHPVDPNHSDLGSKSFITVVKSMLESQGEPFTGIVQIKIMSKADKSFLGGWKSEVYIGKKQRKEGGKGGSDKSDLEEYVFEEMQRSHDAMQQMFSNSSQVIHASSSAINALRGANPTPPWMEGGEGGDPMWMTILNGAMGIAANAGLFNNEPNPAGAMNAASQMMTHPVRGPGAIQQHAHPQLPGPTQHSQGYSQPGEYDGYSVHEEDLLDDEFEEDDEYEYEYEYVEDEDEDEYEYEEQEEEPRARRGGSPLDGMSPEELQKHLNEYIDKNQDKKAKLKTLGFSIAKKLM